MKSRIDKVFDLVCRPRPKVVFTVVDEVNSNPDEVIANVLRESREAQVDVFFIT
jgi:hypothetical protein